MSPRPRQHPKVPQRPSRCPHLAQGQEKMSGKSLEIPFATAWVPYQPRQQQSPPSLLPLCFCNSLPRWRWPHPLLQHEVIASQSRRARRTISSTDWLQGPPLPLPTPLIKRSRSLRGKKTETAISGKDPEDKSRNLHAILVGKPLFYSLASPIFLRDNRLSVPPPLNHRHIKEFPLPSPHIVPPAARKSFPGAKRSRRQQRQLHRQQRQLFTPIHGGREAALTVAVFSLLLLPPTSSVSRSSIETALDSPAPLLSGARSLRTGASSAPSGRRFTP